MAMKHTYTSEQSVPARFRRSTGFTLVELLVSITIIGILSTIVFTSYTESQVQSRDNARQVELKELQLAIERYRSQNGTYPEQGCGDSTTADSWAGHNSATDAAYNDCAPYIQDLTPDYIETLPVDERAGTGEGFYYSTDGSSYKLLVRGSVERLTIDSYDEQFARCPAQAGSCSGSNPPSNTYAVYSLGAEDW